MRQQAIVLWRQFWPLFLIWPFMGLLSVLLTATALMLAGQRVPWVPMIWSMLAWALWILLTPHIIVVTRRWLPGTASLSAVVVAHLGSFLVATTLHSAFVYLLRYLLFGRVVTSPGMTMREDLSLVLPVWTLYDLLVYLTTVAAVSALELHRRLRERAVREAQLEAHVAEAELELMRMQVQPAFILRTLASARTHLAASPRRSEVMISRLAEVLRGSLESLGSDRVRLCDELRHVRNWIAVESLRADRTIALDADSDPDALLQQVPKYLITEVISAVVDATPAGDPVRVHLDAAEVGGLLAIRLSVEGTGCGGVADAVVTQLQRRLQAAAADGWSLTLEETGPARIALSIDRTPADAGDDPGNGFPDLPRRVPELAIEH